MKGRKIRDLKLEILILVKNHFSQDDSVNKTFPFKQGFVNYISSVRILFTT